jgi:TatD DNase family protein
MTGTCIDSHLHFDSFVEAGTHGDIVQRAQDCGVSTLIAIGGSDDANRTALKMTEQFPGHVAAVVGYDRDEAGKPYDEGVLKTQLGNPAVVGVGETGLDYHYSADSAPEQKELFASMLHLSAEYTKPVIVHSREADEDTRSLLKAFTNEWKDPTRHPGVLHCFTGNMAFAEALLDLNFIISFSGIVTFKNAVQIQEVAKVVPADRMLIETDSPYLAPVPYRGKRNEPAYVIEVAKFLAELRRTTADEIMAQTRANTVRLFNL